MPSPLVPARFIQYETMSNVKAQKLEWLWPGRLALGKLAILEGDPGQGKSLVALDLCARLSTGRPFPDGVSNSGPRTAVLLDGEDDVQCTTIPRLQAAGANLERVIHLKAEVNCSGQPLHFPAHLDRLEYTLRKTGAQLLIISPLGAFLDPSASAG